MSEPFDELLAQWNRIEAERGQPPCFRELLDSDSKAWLQTTLLLRFRTAPDAEMIIIDPRELDYELSDRGRLLIGLDVGFLTPNLLMKASERRRPYHQRRAVKDRDGVHFERLILPLSGIDRVSSSSEMIFAVHYHTDSDVAAWPIELSNTDEARIITDGKFL